MPVLRSWMPASMATFYAPEAYFDDEVFSLRGHREVTGMWRTLCSNAG